MAFAIIFLIFLSFSTIEAQLTSTNISLSSSLKPTGTNSSSWLSPSGIYAFGFYRQGSGYAVGVFAAGLPEKTVVWTANRDDPPVPSNATLAFSDGRLVLNTPPAQNPYIAGVTEEISVASMLDSGNFVLYNSIGKIIWQSFDYPTDTILPGQRLMNGNKLISSVSEADHSTGLFRLEMQGDGHLVSYELKSNGVQYAYWASGTNGAGNNITLNLDDRGLLYLLNETGGNTIKNLSAAEASNDGKIYRMTLDADGIFRVHSLTTLDPKGNWSVMWASSMDKCEPKGLCGLNGYCVLNNTEANCRCLPGFNFVNPEKWSLGCTRNFTAVSCDTNGGSAGFNMEEMGNMIFEDQNYEETPVTNKEDCEQSCFEDCNCEVAVYSARGTNMQKTKASFEIRNKISTFFAGCLRQGYKRTSAAFASQQN